MSHDDHWKVIQEEISVKKAPVLWAPFSPYDFENKPDDYWEKAKKIDWAMEHVMFGGDDFWESLGLERAWFNGGIDHYRNVGEAIYQTALDQHGVYGFNLSHGAHLEGPVLVRFYGRSVEFAKYAIRHGFEFLDWLKEEYGEEVAIATTACLELVLVENDDNRSRWWISHVPSNYQDLGVYFWDRAAYDYHNGKIPLESLAVRRGGMISYLDALSEWGDEREHHPGIDALRKELRVLERQ